MQSNFSSLYDHGPVADSPGAKEAQHEAAHSNPEIPWRNGLKFLKMGIFTILYKFSKLRSTVSPSLPQKTVKAKIYWCVKKIISDSKVKHLNSEDDLA